MGEVSHEKQSTYPSYTKFFYKMFLVESAEVCTELTAYRRCGMTASYSGASHHSFDVFWWRQRVATPLWPSVGVKPNTSKVGDLESSRTPKCLELNSKTRNTSHWGVLGVIGNILKCRYRKWPCIGNSDICSPSYGQKKGRESNWQFDSWPLKVGNRPIHMIWPLRL